MRQIADRRVLRCRPSADPLSAPLLRSEVCAGEMKNDGLVWAHDDGITAFFFLGWGPHSELRPRARKNSRGGENALGCHGNEFEWGICQKPHNQH